MLPTPFFIALQHLIPQHHLSRLVGFLAESRIKPLKNWLIRQFVDVYHVELADAVIEDITEFENFNAFFTRELKTEARPIAEGEQTIASPADGSISEIGQVEHGSLIQAKGQYYSLMSLLGGDARLCHQMDNGHFATIYLSPKDYHRVHMPLDGHLRSMTYVPGQLFSVNQTTANQVPNLFARNERLICEFESSQGPFVMILVGAMIVAGIETVWAGQVAPFQVKRQYFSYTDETAVHLRKGEEMGRFKLGSTVILLLPEHAAKWTGTLENGSSTRMGEAIGSITNQPAEHWTSTNDD